MKKSESILMVKFNSTHNAEEMAKVCQTDLETFRNVPGLLQKYYLAEESTGAISGFYMFETKEDREKFWASDLAKSIPAKYGVILETLRVEQYEVAIILNESIEA